jgi:Domain of unknown function (DUF4352)
MSQTQQPHGIQQDPHGQPPQPPQYGYQVPQPGYPPQAGGYYQPPVPQPPRRKRHVVRNAAVGVVGLIALLIVVTSLASKGSTPSVSTKPTTSDGGSAQATGAPAAPATAVIGSTIGLTGNLPGENMSVTVVKVVSHAAGSDEFNTPDAGNRFYAVQFRLTDTGSVAYSDAPSNGAEVVDDSGQSYQSDISTVAGCQSFPGTENIAVGSTGLGCVVFQVPKHAKITEVQFTLDSGLANQTGQWKV